MKIYHGFERASHRPLSLAIGFFDGMHRGHYELVRKARTMRKPGWRVGVLTFADHPASFLRPGAEPPLITTPHERLNLFAQAGFEECYFVRFDASVANLEPQQFLEDVVLRALRAGSVVVGKNFRFGHKRAGDAEQMRQFCDQHGIGFADVENVVDDGERISSTRIRALIAAGDVEQADRLLGHAYEIRGRVELGAGRGHDLGFPTANVRVPRKLLPKDGVYAATARHDGRDYATLVSIGKNPHFGGTERTIEAWLRDFHHTVYGCELTLRDLRFVREQRTFATVHDLMEQMQGDLSAVAYPTFSST